MKRFLAWLVPVFVIAMLLCPVLLVLPAIAASSITVSTPSGAAIGGGVLLWLNSTAGIIGMAVGLWFLQQWLRTYVASKGLEADARVREYLMPLLDMAVNAAFARLGPMGLLASVGPAASPDALALRREQEAEVVRYVQDTAKGGLEHFGRSAADVRRMASERLDALAAGLMKRDPAVAAH